MSDPERCPAGHRLDRFMVCPICVLEQKEALIEELWTVVYLAGDACILPRFPQERVAPSRLDAMETFNREARRLISKTNRKEQLAAGKGKR